MEPETGPPRAAFWKKAPGTATAVGGLLAGVAAVVTAVVAITGGSESPSPSPVPIVTTTTVAGDTPTTDGEASITRNDLARAQLTKSDLPSGWVRGTPSSFEFWPCNQPPPADREVISPGALFDLVDAQGTVAEAVSTRLDAYKNADDAKAALGLIRTNADRCRDMQFSGTVGSRSLSFQVSPVAGFLVADETVTVLVTQTDNATGVKYNAAASFIRWGRTLVVAQYGDLGAHDPVQQLGLLTERVVDRLRSLPK